MSRHQEGRPATGGLGRAVRGSVRSGLGGVELGYFFHPAAWGQGYGTELARSCMAWADDAPKLPEVRAFAHPENVASQRVLTKTGFMAVRFIPKLNRLVFTRVPARNG